MVQLDLFENSLKKQTLRTIIALAIIIPSDIIYTFMRNGSMNVVKINIMAYLNVWITLAVVFGVSILTSDKYDVKTVNKDTITNYVGYGALIGLLVYVPLYNWLVALNNLTKRTCLSNTAAGVVLSSFVCLFVFLISEKFDLI